MGADTSKFDHIYFFRSDSIFTDQIYTSVIYQKLAMLKHTKIRPSKNYHYSRQICMETVARSHKSELFYIILDQII